jgi:hypothetical protein
MFPPQAIHLAWFARGAFNERTKKTRPETGRVEGVK